MKALNFSGNFETCDLKVGRYRQLIDLMKCCEYSRSMSFFTLTKGHSHIKFKTLFSQKLLD